MFANDDKTNYRFVSGFTASISTVIQMFLYTVALQKLSLWQQALLTIVSFLLVVSFVYTIVLHVYILMWRLIYKKYYLGGSYWMLYYMPNNKHDQLNYGIASLNQEFVTVRLSCAMFDDKEFFSKPEQTKIKHQPTTVVGKLYINMDAKSSVFYLKGMSTLTKSSTGTSNSVFIKSNVANHNVYKSKVVSIVGDISIVDAVDSKQGVFGKIYFFSDKSHAIAKSKELQQKLTKDTVKESPVVAKDCNREMLVVDMTKDTARGVSADESFGETSGTTKEAIACAPLIGIEKEVPNVTRITKVASKRATVGLARQASSSDKSSLIDTIDNKKAKDSLKLLKKPINATNSKDLKSGKRDFSSLEIAHSTKKVKSKPLTKKNVVKKDAPSSKEIINLVKDSKVKKKSKAKL